MSRTSTSKRTETGFTLMEMLIVLGLMALLFGIGAGAWTRALPAGQLASYEVRDAVRRARNFAIKEGAPAFVSIDAPIAPEMGAVLTTGGQRPAGVWHFEEQSLMGFPGAGLGVAFDIVPGGIIGNALKLAADKPSYVDLGRASAYDAIDGVYLELFVKPYGHGARTLIEKGKSYGLSLDNELRLRGFVLLRTETELARDPGKQLPIQIEEPLPEGRFSRVTLAFDGKTIELFVDGRLRNFGRLPARQAMLPDAGAALLIGRVDQPFAGEVDEVHVSTFVLERARELPSGVRFGRARTEIRFDATGKLDRLLHNGPVEIAFQSGDPPKPRSLKVDLLGEIR